MQSLTSWFLADSWQIFATLYHNLAKAAPKSMKIRLNFNKKSTRGGLRSGFSKQVVSRTSPGGRTVNSPVPFFDNFGDIGGHLGPTWRQMAAQGCQNGAQNRSKIDAEIDAKINIEKVSKKMPKVGPK